MEADVKARRDPYTTQTLNILTAITRIIIRFWINGGTTNGGAVISICFDVGVKV